MIPTILASLFGGLTILALAAILWGFRHSINSDNPITRWFVRGFGWIAAGYMLRGFYWDVFWQTFRYLDRDRAYVWSDVVGGTAINIIFYVMVLYGIYCVLKCREAMIEEAERWRWPWYKAWMHPDRFTIIRWPGGR